MAREPVGERLGSRGLRVCVAARSERPDEQLRPEGLFTMSSVDRHGASGVIDEELLAGEVPLAHRALQALLPAPVALAKGAAPVGGFSVPLDVLFPQQLQRHMPMALELRMHPGEVRRHQLWRLAGRAGAKYPLLELALGQRLRIRRADPRRPHRP